MGIIVFVAISTYSREPKYDPIIMEKVQRPIPATPTALICQSDKEELLPFFDTVIYVFTEEEEKELFKILENTYLPAPESDWQHEATEIRSPAFVVRSKIPSFSPFFKFDEDGRLMAEELKEDEELRLKKLMDSVFRKIEQRKNELAKASLFLFAEATSDRIPFVYGELNDEPISQDFFVVEFDLLNRPSRISKVRSDGVARSCEWEKFYGYYMDTPHVRIFAYHDLLVSEFRYYDPTGDFSFEAKGEEAKKMIDSYFFHAEFLLKREEN